MVSSLLFCCSGRIPRLSLIRHNLYVGVVEKPPPPTVTSPFILNNSVETSHCGIVVVSLWYIYIYGINMVSIISSCHNTVFVIKGTVHPHKIFLKCVMLRTVTKNSTIIIMKYTWHHRYREIVQITREPPLRLHRKPDPKAGKRKLIWCDVTWSLSRLTRIVVSLEL